MERVTAWREGLGVGDDARASTTSSNNSARLSSNIIDLTSDSSNDGGSPDSVRIINRPTAPVQQQQQQPRPKAQPSLFLPRQQQPLRPLNNQAPPPKFSFASSSAAFGQPNRLAGMPRIPKQQPRFEVDDDASPEIQISPASTPNSVTVSQPKFASSSKAFQVPSNSNGARSSTGSLTSGGGSSWARQSSASGSGASTSTMGVGASQGGLNVKQRIALAMQQEAKSKGIAMGTPIAVPKNPARIAPRPATHSHSHAATSSDPLAEESLPDLGFSDNLTSADQEAALAELLSTTLDLSATTTLASDTPSSLLCSLLPHQVQGLHWLKDREKGKKRGGILADDMGLGKTVQMLALILANPSDGTVKLSTGRRCKTTLIICPVALMQQWKTEIETKSDAELTVCIHHGNGKKTARQLTKYDIVLTSYNTAAAEWVDPKPKRGGKGKGKKKGSDEEEDSDAGAVVEKKERGPLFGVEKWYRSSLDEAHSIKGRTTKAHKACCDLAGHYKWCLSGTPIQNGVLDLFSLFEFLGKIVNPLHDYSEFKLKISDPLKNKRTKIAMTRLAVVLKAVMLRRTKTMMIDGKPLLALPGREIIEIKGPFLDEDERAFYKAVEEKMTLTMNAFLKAGTAMSNYTSVLILLLRMRQACSHPSLVTGSNAALDREALSDPDPASAVASVPEEDDLSSLLSGLGSLSVAQGRQCALCDQSAQKGGEEPYCARCEEMMRGLGGVKMSTKVRKMMGVLEGIRKEDPKRKTIVFSQFTSMFNVIEPFLKTAGYKFVRFDGKLNAVQKEAALKKIREDPKTTIILISIKCGSVGLNLTVCSRVILLDLWWNPAIEAQAFDRAHRFGQKEDVKIYKITVDNTIEDRILTLQEEKAEIAKAALEGGDMTKANKLSMRDMLYLFRGDGEGAREGKGRGKAREGDESE
ncbi:SNF2 family N-terminal domain-domain-containing protein [Leucosporidium creatinivorum]|uniref:SNF2 family N-terminal domain-domain-containing protein n=1 Tax=Leucosporidium creatinivorum TaxID=106004 RepID=A0A1Y2E2S8_9BASI|nr:SNF2 family N-terminal domain-domain-containing protein [Leucosporidium creatinivorum]